jgi:hypothetical protein
LDAIEELGAVRSAGTAPPFPLQLERETRAELTSALGAVDSSHLPEVAGVDGCGVASATIDRVRVSVQEVVKLHAQ